MRKDPLLGSKVGDYEILERIGEGGMGIVYRGIQPLIQKRVAIKVLRPDVAADPVQEQRLVEEAVAVNAISHRGIVDIFGTGSLPDGRRYVVMEFLEGEPLDFIVSERSPMAAAEALPLVDEVCSVLAAAHAAGVVHRDLKTGNIFVVRQPDGARYVKVLDFGLAKRSRFPGARTAQSVNAQVVGTPDCMAPEQARGEEVSARTDLYALGVAMFEMFTARLPFIAPTAIEVLMRHLDTPPPVPSSIVAGIPPQVDGLILRLLAKDPAARPESAEAVRGEIARVCRELGVRPGLSGAAGPRPAPDLDQTLPAGVAVPDLAVRKQPLPAAETEEISTQPVVVGESSPWRRAVLIGLGGCIVALSVVVGWLMFTNGSRPVPAAQPARPPVASTATDPGPPVEPPVPVRVTAPVTSTVGVAAPGADPKVPRPAPDASHGPRPEAGPSSAALEQRIADLEKKFRASGRPDELDPTALKLLDRYRIQATAAKTPADRKKIIRALDDWKRTFLH